MNGREELADLLDGHDALGCGCCCFYDAEKFDGRDAALADAILASPWLADLRRRERAAAWDEGFAAGFYDPLAGGISHDACESTRSNPYDRADDLDGGEEVSGR